MATVVLDVGKTHSKLTLWEQQGTLLAHEIRPNALVEGGPYRALDALGIQTWMAATLASFARRAAIACIIPVAHGAAAALLRHGRLLCAPLDYEHPLPDPARRRYLELRDPFSVTGSPALPLGLNLGAQLYYLSKALPDLLSPGTLIVPWAQYWAWVLSGVAAAEVTSWGCHTDLWQPWEHGPSPLAVRRGWAELYAPLRRAGDVLGTLRPEWAACTGLSPRTQVLCGLHDSNAALLGARGFPQFAHQESTVVSTGTWFVAMRTPETGAAALTPMAASRDCLVNVDASGRCIPSARSMGGRELELLTDGSPQRIDDSAAQPRLLDRIGALVASRSMALPTLLPGVGPYPDAIHGWRNRPADPTARMAAAALYAALVLDASLDLIGARSHILIEGRFSRAEVFVRALAALRPAATFYRSAAHDGVALGARRLVEPALAPPCALEHVTPLDLDLSAYRDEWRNAAERVRAAPAALA